MKKQILMAICSSSLMASAMGLGCGDGSTGPGPEATGRMSLYLTDAPFPFDMVDSTTVMLDSVSVHYNSNGDGSGFRTVDLASRSINLLDLQNGIMDSLLTIELPVGTVNQVRLHVSEASVVLSDGRSFELDIPSGDTSGIKVFPSPPVEIVGALTTELLLDFDVSRSFESVPSSPGHVDEISEFHFHPVLRVSTLSATGSMSGKVWGNAGTQDDFLDDVPLEGVQITVWQMGAEITGTATEADGSYRLIGLPGGTYSLEASAAGYVSASQGVSVVVGNEIGGRDFHLLAE